MNKIAEPKLISIFDSITHPTLNGDWIVPRYAGRSDVESLHQEMAECNIRWAFAVGMKGIGAYSEKEYVRYLDKYSVELFPIAFFPSKEVQTAKQVIAWVKRIKKLRYFGIKIHPRIEELSLKNRLLETLVSACNEERIAVLFCSYFFNASCSACFNMQVFQEFAERIHEFKILVLHAGTVQLMEMIETARAHPNLLLDLSLTLCKYEGSSIDLDIAFAFRSFDKRICVGSDHPEYSLQKLRERFEHFSHVLDLEKKTNIAYKNIFNFFAQEFEQYHAHCSIPI